MTFWKVSGAVRIAIPEGKVPSASLPDIQRGQCMCGYELDRVAFRNVGKNTRPWTAFGYRCYSCETIYVDRKPS